MIDFQEFGDFGDCPRISVAGVELGVSVSPMKIPLPLRGIRVIRGIRGQKKQPRITQISRKTHHKRHLHSQWRAAGSWKLGGEHGFVAPTTKDPRHKESTIVYLRR